MGINSGRRFGTSGTLMFTHGKIDALARRYGSTPSGLAKRAGLGTNQIGGEPATMRQG